jgi:hypothetical protein
LLDCCAFNDLLTNNFFIDYCSKFVLSPNSKLVFFGDDGPKDLKPDFEEHLLAGFEFTLHCPFVKPFAEETEQSAVQTVPE